MRDIIPQFSLPANLMEVFVTPYEPRITTQCTIIQMSVTPSVTRCFKMSYIAFWSLVTIPNNAHVKESRICGNMTIVLASFKSSSM